MVQERTSTTLSLGKALRPPEPIGARDEVQNALQWLARMTQSFGASSGQDLALIFDERETRFLTPDLAPTITLELALPGVVLQFLESGAPSPHAMDVDDKSSAEIEAWLLTEMLHRGFERDHFSKTLPYQWEHLLGGDERKYAPSSHVGELRHLTERLVAASCALLALRSIGRPDEAGDGHLLCWPESLEIGFVSPGENGAADLKASYLVGDDQRGIASAYVVRPMAGTPRLLELSSVDAGEIYVDAMSEAEIVDRMTSMMAAAR